MHSSFCTDWTDLGLEVTESRTCSESNQSGKTEGGGASVLSISFEES
jgi:hypothetical protein